MADLFRRRRHEPPEPLDAEPASPLLQRWFEAVPDESALWWRPAPGPRVDELTARLAQTPAPFLDAALDLPALVADVLDGDAAAVGTAQDVAAHLPDAVPRVALAVWLWASEDLLGPCSVPLDRAQASRVLLAFAVRLAATGGAADRVGDADGREEAARLLLLAAEQLPGGEGPVDARALFDRYDGVRRDAALRAAMEDHAHREAVLRRLREQRAREAAARYAPE